MRGWWVVLLVGCGQRAEVPPSASPVAVRSAPAAAVARVEGTAPGPVPLAVPADWTPIVSVDGAGRSLRSWRPPPGDARETVAGILRDAGCAATPVVVDRQTAWSCPALGGARDVQVSVGPEGVALSYGAP